VYSSTGVPTAHNVRDLGVLIDSHLTFCDHINMIVSRGHLRSMQIWRCFSCKNANILCKAFTTYVRMVLEYCSPVWSPVTVMLINQLDSVERRFTKRLPGFQLLPYDERCALLGLDRLELRRICADLIFCYKFIRGLVLLSADRFFTCSYNSVACGHSFKLFLPDSRVNCRQHFFAVRMLRIWNSLPEEVVSSDHLPLFIRHLQGAELNQFLIGKT